MNMHKSHFYNITICWLTLFTCATADERESELVMLQPGVKLTLVAEHPELATPTGIDVDDQGRVWIVATHTHFRPDDYLGPLHDEILIFSGTNHDGRAHKRQVFYARTDATMDLELGRDGWVYLAERDRILRIRDSDEDGTADVEETLITLETEADYPHNGLEGLAWHPDGDLVFGLGENFAKPWNLTGADSRTFRGTGEGGIFRCSAQGDALHRIARGFWNPFGICVREDGEIFAAENDPGEMPPCRLLHIVEGGDYGYQRTYGTEAHHPFVAWNGELKGTLPMIHPSGEAPCGVLPLGRGLLVPSWSDHRLDYFLLQRSGASFTAERTPLLSGGRFFRPSCIASAPAKEGDVSNRRVWYLADWVDGRYQAHGYGRVWKLEIDLDQAAVWLGPTAPEPLTAEAKLAASLRQGATTLNPSMLFDVARGIDPFLARAALLGLSKHAENWSIEELKGWPARDRVQAVQALKIAGSDPTQWIAPLLLDPNSEVQFETLRWISEAELSVFKPELETFLNRSDLNFQLFEAAIATWNILDGHPEAGIRNPEMLLARVQDPESSPHVRAFALRLLPQLPLTAPAIGSPKVFKFPAGLTMETLEDLLSINDNPLSLEVIRTLSGNVPESRPILARIANDDNQDLALRLEAISGLASFAERESELFIKLAGEPNVVIQREALRSLRGVQLSADQQGRIRGLLQSELRIAESIHAVLNPGSLANGRPDSKETSAWLTLLQGIAEPADLDHGRRLFHSRIAQCASCHRRNGRGNVVGPDLSRLAAAGDHTWLVESVLQPSLRVAPEYQPRTLILKDGRVFTGIRLRSYTKETIRDSNGQNQTFDRGDIESMIDSHISFMPNGLANLLTLNELRDLIAFLESDEAAE